MQKDINDLLQDRIKNEKKQKRITTITAIMFSVFAIVIIGLTIHSYKQEEIINTQKKQLEIAKTQDSITLSRAVVAYEKKADNVTNELNKIEKTIKTDNSLRTYNSSSNNAEIDSSNSYLNKNYIIYIQFRENLAEQSTILKNTFIKEKYKVAKEQNMKNLNFSSSVRYFYKSDKDKAEQIAKKAQEVINKKFNVQYLKLKSPQNQIEIWVGR